MGRFRKTTDQSNVKTDEGQQSAGSNSFRLTKVRKTLPHTTEGIRQLRRLLLQHVSGPEAPGSLVPQCYVRLLCQFDGAAGFESNRIRQTAQSNAARSGDQPDWRISNNFASLTDLPNLQPSRMGQTSISS